jgi:hypothetical protein
MPWGFFLFILSKSQATQKDHRVRGTHRRSLFENNMRLTILEPKLRVDPIQCKINS